MTASRREILIFASVMVLGGAVLLALFFSVCPAIPTPECVQLIVVFGFPFLGSGLGILSIIEVLGQSWHRPRAWTRALGVVGLLATLWIGGQWLVMTLYFATEIFYALSYIS